MSSSGIRLSVVFLPGLRPDSPGNYLASLGLLRLLAGCWPGVRIAWRDEVLHVVGGPASLEKLLERLCEFAENGCWTPYERRWAAAQKQSTKSKSGRPLAVWQADADEGIIELFAAHTVPHARVSFNPLLGTGGNAGKRAFSDGWKQAVDALAPPAPSKPGKNESELKKAAREKKDRDRAEPERARKRDELQAFLLGKPITWTLEKLNAASWFSDANKLYNSGQAAYREGQISPWAMALACEGLSFWAGAASRRLGARARAQGAFPFVARAAAPSGAGEAGRDLAELWAPLWERPMTVPEVRALFARGRAEIRGRGANTPAAFAAAIVRRGVDAGVSHFVRFSLGRTTSAKTFEPRLEGVFAVRPEREAPDGAGASATAFERLLSLIERLPADRKVGKRWRFVGLRGPVEAAMLRVAQAPADPVAVRALLDATVTALDRVDRNRSFREKRVAWEPLPIGYLPALFGAEAPSVEARLALALVSAFPVARPFALYRFGVEARYGRFEHTERPPARWVWRPGSLPQVLAEVLMRKTLDEESDRTNGREDERARLPVTAAAADVGRWLDGAVDEALLALWIGRLALFDWRSIARAMRELFSRNGSVLDANGALVLAGLLQPLFDRRPLRARALPGTDDLLSAQSGARTPGAARAIASLIRTNQIDAAVRLAASRYAMAGVPLIRTATPWSVAEPDRLLASTLFAMTDHGRSTLIDRWLRPRRLQGEHAHA